MVVIMIDSDDLENIFNDMEMYNADVEIDYENKVIIVEGKITDGTEFKQEVEFT